jgi:sugar/nucleoside kinase (ribokinase family)
VVGAPRVVGTPDRVIGERAPRAGVLGDLVLDIVLRPDGPLSRGTDVAGRIGLRQGGSAATTARWLARRGVSTRLITAVGADRVGQLLMDAMQRAGVDVRAVTIGSAGTGRLGVFVEADGERSFVADRGAILRLRPGQVSAAWLAGLDLLHLPVYSLLADPLAATSLRAADRVRAQGGHISVDLASAGFIERFGPGTVLERVAAAQPAVVFATADESAAALGRATPEGLLTLAELVVIKEGAVGARLLTRRGPTIASTPPRREQVEDSTGAGDAFDAGFLAAWLRARTRDRDGGAVAGRRFEAAARRWLREGHRAARVEVLGRRPELPGM